MMNSQVIKPRNHSEQLATPRFLMLPISSDFRSSGHSVIRTRFRLAICLPFYDSEPFALRNNLPKIVFSFSFCENGKEVVH